MWRVYRVECDSVSLKYSLSYANWDGYFIWSRLFLFDFQSLGLEMKFWNSEIWKNFAIVKFQSGFFSRGIVKILEFVDLKKILSFKNFQYSKKNSWQFQVLKRKKKRKRNFETLKIVDIEEKVVRFQGILISETWSLKYWRKVYEFPIESFIRGILEFWKLPISKKKCSKDIESC